MKKYTKPELITKEVAGINESVYMACSGTEYFDFGDGSGWTHQYPEDGRWNFAEQVNGKYKGPDKHKEGSNLVTYAFVTFDSPVNIESVHGWEWVNTWGPVPNGDTEGSYTIIGKRVWPDGFNYNEGIGLGSLYVVPEDPTVETLKLEKVVISWSYDGYTVCT